MSYKRFIVINGKRYGPYEYHSIRTKDGSVKSIYRGKEEKKEKKRKKSKRKISFPISKEHSIFFISLALLLIFSTLIILNSPIYPQITGKAILNPENNIFQVNKPLNGNLNLLMNEGEFLPSTSIITTTIQDTNINININKQITLKSFIESSTSHVPLEEQEGSFYTTATNLSGSGLGYGFPGKRIIYPEINFQLNILQETPPTQSNETNEINQTNQTNENKNETLGMPEETRQSSQQQTIKTIKETISAFCSKENPFIYNLNEDETAELVPGSVRYNNISLEDSIINLNIIDNQSIILTTYSIEEQGFGEEFLGEEKTIALDMSVLEMIIEEPGDYEMINILSHNEQQISKTETTITIEKLVQVPQPEPPIQNISNITPISLEPDPEKISEQHEKIKIGSPVKWNSKIKAIDEKKAKKILPLDANITRIIIEEQTNLTNLTIFSIDYETPKIEQIEQESTEEDIIKRVIIRSNFSGHYHNISISTTIVSDKEIKLYHLINNESIDITNNSLYNISINKTGNIQQISWLIPELSEQIFEFGEESGGEGPEPLGVGGGQTNLSYTKRGKDCILHYNFDENLTTQHDRSGNNNNGTVSDASWNSTGKYGGALIFDGINDYVNAGNVSIANGATPFSIEFWVYPYGEPFNTVNGQFLQKSGSYEIRFYNDRLALVDIGENYAEVVSVDGQISNGNWYHFVTVYDGSDAILYKNGVVFETAWGSMDNSWDTSSNNLNIGTGGSHYLNGTIDELKIYDRALSPEEIQARYADSKCGHTINSTKLNDTNVWIAYESGSVLYFPFEEDETPQQDWSRNHKNNGTVTGATFNATGCISGDGCYEFGGDTDNIKVNYDASVEVFPNTEWTFEAWIKPTDLGDGSQTILNGIWHKPWILYSIANDQLVFAGFNGSKTPVYKNFLVSTANSINPNKWNHIVLISDGTNYKWYINGDLDSSATYEEVSTENPGYYYLGKTDNAGENFNGTMDEVRIYSKTLSTGEILQHYYHGLKILNASGTCFTVGKADAVLDGEDYLINYGLETGGYAITNENGYDGVIIKNFDINQSNTSNPGFHIFLNNSDHSKVEFNNMTNGKAGILVLDSDNVTLRHNYGSRFDYGAATAWATCDPFNTTSTYKFYESGIWLVESNNATIFNNTIYGDVAESGTINHGGTEAGITLCKCNYSNITQNYLYYLDTFGFNLAQSHHNDFFYNFINGSNFTGTTNTNDGIIFGGASGNVDQGACDYNNFSHNKVYGCSEWGIFLSQSDNNMIRNNTANSNAVGIRVGGTSSYNKVYDNIVQDNDGGAGWGIGVEGNYNILTNNNLSSNTIGIKFSDATAGYCHDNVAIDEKIDSSTYGVYFDLNALAGCQNNTIRDSQITSSSSNDIYATALEGTQTLNATFLNVSLDASTIDITADVEDIGGVYIKWYVDVAANYSNNSAAPGATVKIHNKSGALKLTDTVESTSLITRQNITELYETSSGKTFMNNYTFNATKTGAVSQTESVNITTNNISSNKVQLSISGTGCGCSNGTYNYDCGQTVYESCTLNCDLSCTGNGLIIGNNDLEIDGAGYMLTFATLEPDFAFGILSSEYSGTFVKNLKINSSNISMQSFSVLLNYSNHSRIEEVNMSFGKAGVLVSNSSNATIKHNYFSKFDYGAATAWATCDPFNTTSTYKFYESGIWLVESNNATIFNNTIYGDNSKSGIVNHDGTEAGVTLCKCNYTNITQNNIYYTDTFGFILSQSHHNDFFYNLVNGSNTTGVSNTNDGIILGGPSGDVDSGACNNNNLSHNEFYDCSEWGLFLTGSNNNIIYNNTANSNSVGIRIGGTSSSNKIYENTVNSNTNYGLGIEGNYNEVINLTSISNTQRGISLADATAGYCHDNIIINAEIDSNTYGVYFSVDALGGCQNNTIKDSIITNSGTNDIHAIEGLEGTQILNATFLNVSLDKTKISFSPDIENGAIYIKWYVDVAANYTNNNPGTDATVKIHNKSGAIKYTDTVESTSLITRQNITEFYEDSSGKTFMNNYTFNATKDNYVSETESVNITTNKIDSTKIVLTLREKPLIILYNPINNTWANNTLNFSFKVDGDNDNYNASLYIASNLGSTFHFNGSKIVNDNTLEVITPTSSLGDSNYRWYINVTNDTVKNQSVTWTLHVDTIIPLIEFVSPTAADNTRRKNNSAFYINVTVNDDRTPSNVSAVIDFNKSLRAWYRFEYDVNNVSNAFDSSTNNNNGTLMANINKGLDNKTSSGWTTSGYRGKAMKFDGVNDYILVEDDPSLDINGNITIDAWVYPQSSALSGSIRIMSKRYSAIAYEVYMVSGYLGFSISTSAYGTSTTALLVADKWQHIAITHDGSTARFWINGKEYASKSLNEAVSANNEKLYIGRIGHSSATQYFNGTIDELKIHSRVLTEQEIKASYNAGINQLQKNFTNLAPATYEVRAYVVDSAGNLNKTENRTFKINHPPAPVTLTYPAVDAHITNRTDQFNWANTTDIDDTNDDLTYVFNISCWPAGCTPDDDIYSSGLTNNITLLTDVTKRKNFWDDNEYYEWEIRAWDGYDYSDGINYTLYLDSVVSITMLNDTIEFKEMGNNETMNTTTNDPWPFSVYNDGNCYVNISINATNLWLSYPNPSDYYKFKADRLAEEYDSFNYATSTTAWTQMPITSLTFINFLNYTDSNDTAETDIYIRTPLQGNETPGDKYSNVTFIGTYVEEGS